MKLYGIDEISKMFGVTRNAVVNWIQTDKLKATKIGGEKGLYVIKERDLVKYLLNKINKINKQFDAMGYEVIVRKKEEKEESD